MTDANAVPQAVIDARDYMSLQLRHDLVLSHIEAAIAALPQMQSKELRGYLDTYVAAIAEQENSANFALPVDAQIAKMANIARSIADMRRVLRVAVTQ